MMLKIARKESFSKTAGSRLFEVNFNGKQGEVYFFILVARPKINAFIREINDTAKPRNLRDFGIILESGYGKPTEALRQKLNKKYN